MSKQEQRVIVTTKIKLDYWERLKVLFGKVIIVTQSSYIPQDNPINHFNTVTTITFDNTINHFTIKDKPDFGYSPKKI